MTTTSAALRFPLPADCEVFVLFSTHPQPNAQTCPLSLPESQTPRQAGAGAMCAVLAVSPMRPEDAQLL